MFVINRRPVILILFLSSFSIAKLSAQDSTRWETSIQLGRNKPVNVEAFEAPYNSSFSDSPNLSYRTIGWGNPGFAPALGLRYRQSDKWAWQGYLRYRVSQITVYSEERNTEYRISTNGFFSFRSFELPVQMEFAPSIRIAKRSREFRFGAGPVISWQLRSNRGLTGQVHYSAVPNGYVKELTTASATHPYNLIVLNAEASFKISPLLGSRWDLGVGYSYQISKSAPLFNYHRKTLVFTNANQSPAIIERSQQVSLKSSAWLLQLSYVLNRSRRDS